MSTKKMPVFIHLSKHQYGTEIEYTPFVSDMTEYGYTLVATPEVEFEEPSTAEVVAGIVRGLQREQQQIKADAQMKVQQIQERINSVLAIEHKEEA